MKRILMAALAATTLVAATPASAALKSEWSFVGQWHGEAGTCVIGLDRRDEKTGMVPEKSREIVIVWSEGSATLQLRSDEWQDDGRQRLIQDDMYNGEHRATVTVRRAKGKPATLQLSGNRPNRMGLYFQNFDTDAWENFVKDAKSIDITFGGYKHQSPWSFDRINREDTLLAFRGFNECVRKAK